MGRVHPQLPAIWFHRVHCISMLPGLQTTTVSNSRGAGSDPLSPKFCPPLQMDMATSKKIPAPSLQRWVDHQRTKAPRYRAEERVMLATRGIPLRTLSLKLSPRFIGPFTVSLCNRSVHHSTVAPIIYPLNQLHLPCYRATMPF